MLNKTDVRQIMVGKTSTALSTGKMDGLNVGEIGAFTPSGVRVKGNNVAAQDKIVLALKLRDKVFQISDVIEKAELQYVTAQGGKDDQESIDYIGFNGTDGDIQAIDNNDYFLTVFIEAFFESESDGRYNKHARASTGKSASKYDVARQLRQSLAWNVGLQSKEPEKYLTSELVSNAAIVAAPAGTVAFDFVHNSKYVATTLSTGIVVGDYIRAGITKADPVYEVVGIASNVFELAEPYQGPTESKAHTAVKLVTKAAFEGAEVGIKIKSLPLTFDPNRLGRSRFRKAIYNFSMANFGTTKITRAQAATKGRNAVETVAELQYFQQGFEFGDNHYQVGEPNLFRDIITVDFTEDAYDVVNIKWRHRLVGGFREDMSNKEIQLFYPKSAPPAWYSDATNGLKTILESFAGLTADDLKTW